MNDKQTINSLEDLKRRKTVLRLETELIKREFSHSLGTTRANTGNFLLKQVALPIGAVGGGLYFLKKLIGSGKSPGIIKETKVIHEYPQGPPRARKAAATGKYKRPKKSRTKAFAAIVSIGKLIIPVVQAIIGAMNSHEAKAAAKEAKRAAD